MPLSVSTRIRGADDAGAERGRRPLGRALVVSAVIVAVVVAAAALAGVLWEWWWKPPEGVALGGEFVFTPDGLTRDFSGTGLYVVIAAVVGLVVGALVALRSDGHEVASLLALLLGSGLGAWVMSTVGAALGPPDADRAARDLKDYAPLVQDLRIEGAAAWLTMPTAALLAAAAVFLILSRRRHD
jgi:hypothetical protein